MEFNIYWPVLVVLAILVLQIVWILVLKNRKSWIHNNPQFVMDDIVHAFVCGSIILLLCSEGYTVAAAWAIFPVLCFGSFALLNQIYQQVLDYQSCGK